MARNTLSGDFLQDSEFWLMDVAPIEPLALPIFTPIAGFHSISMPDITLELAEFQEGNSLWKRKVVKHADVSNITLMRGAKFYDADFYRWIMAAVRGTTQGFDLLPTLGAGAIGGPTPRRNLLLVHYFRHTPLNVQTTAGIGVATNAALLGAAEVISGGVGLGSISAAAQLAVAVSPLGPFDLYPKIPARAWLLIECVPTRYKPGSDFDASSGQISLMELEIAVESMEEISLAAN